MKNFSSAYNNSRSNVLSEKRMLVEQQHAQIVEAVKKEFAIKSFSSLNENQRTYCKNLIDCMWDKENGLNEKGKQFVNEATMPLTKVSTDEQIKKAFMREAKANADAIILCVAKGGDSCSALSKIKDNIEKETGKKLSPKTIREWVLNDIIVKGMTRRLNAIKY